MGTNLYTYSNNKKLRVDESRGNVSSVRRTQDLMYSQISLCDCSSDCGKDCSDYNREPLLLDKSNPSSPANSIFTRVSS
ncbi:hypothetical protein TNIN_29371 [Trichonephila inaurata madagascariensis]|uniref:Uncharacterized protein n=1 Tax=Trichonephila inaurata madagascariensis TaxID=2747483 RepID=A0A8X6YF03_9ARAC|nr:hypothetical protein TNIN_29371 [Trichonephila inaurata madagascariensis]